MNIKDVDKKNQGNKIEILKSYLKGQCILLHTLHHKLLTGCK